MKIKLNRLDTAPATPDKVQFIQYHFPPVESGVYRATVEQTVQTTQTNKIPSQSFESTLLLFAVQGERFKSLSSQQVSEVFPPDKSVGDHSNVLPHISFTRSTLPWERLAIQLPSDANDDMQLAAEKVPWLALLLFHEPEKPALQQITLGQLTNGAAKFPDFELEPGESGDDPVWIIDIPRTLANIVLPTGADLYYLAHVRQSLDLNDQFIGDEVSSVICNRLPALGSSSAIHLVSLEERYDSNYNFDYQGAGDNDLIRFVVLYSWEMSCFTESFEHEVEGLGRVPSVLQPPLLKPDAPDQNTDSANEWLSLGYLPLRHQLRNGQTTVSWYHGPFAPGRSTDDDLVKPAKTSDSLLRYYSSTGMFDVSYAAAWELGRWLTLANKLVSLSLFDYKQRCARNLFQAEQELGHLHLPMIPGKIDTDVPPDVEQWFQDLHLLKHVPFNYVVPDMSMLPMESLRFFQVDKHWVQCLLDGAFSVGMVYDPGDTGSIEMENEQLTGFIIRSHLLKDYPSFLFKGYDIESTSTDLIDAAHALKVLRAETLSETLFLVIFWGEVKTLDLYRKPERLHFGLDEPDDHVNYYYKVLRDNDGEENWNKQVPVPFREKPESVPVDISRPVDMDQLASRMKAKLAESRAIPDWDSADFAREMIEGTARVRFARGSGARGMRFLTRSRAQRRGKSFARPADRVAATEALPS